MRPDWEKTQQNFPTIWRLRELSIQSIIPNVRNGDKRYGNISQKFAKNVNHSNRKFRKRRVENQVEWKFQQNYNVVVSLLLLKFQKIIFHLPL